MAKVGGIYDSFSDLEELPIDNIVSKLDRKEDPVILENELGNRILYPQTVPLTNLGLDFDLAVLESVLGGMGKKMCNITSCGYSPHSNKIYIPEGFLERLPKPLDIVKVFIDALKPSGVVTLYQRSEKTGNKILGTVLRPKLTTSLGEVSLLVSGKKYQNKIGGLTIIPAPLNRYDIRFESREATLLGKNQLATEVAGGALGIVLDARGN